MVKYNAVLIITGAFKRTSRDKIYQELSLESLTDRRWTSQIFFHKITLGLLPSYLKDYLIPCDNLKTYLIRSSTQEIIKTFPARTKTFESSFFPCCAETWGNLSKELRNINSINTFKSSILNFVRPRENSAFEAFEVNYLLRCDLYSIYGLELLNDICALNESLKNSSEENYLIFVTTNFRDVFY